ncbi:MAG: hypothetical protein OJF50_002671 [Nitrospira sp.]|jgi:hypothetical protein|nr:hypothetical protein [Nitrospira sp.]
MVPQWIGAKTTQIFKAGSSFCHGDADPPHGVAR